MKNYVNFFPGSNTYCGFKSLYPYLYQNCKQVFILKGGPGTGKSTLLKKLAKAMETNKEPLEYHWCSSDPDSLDGIVFPRLKVAFVDGNPPHIIDPLYPGIIEEIIYLGTFWDSKYLKAKGDLLIRLTDRVKERFNQAYNFLAQARLSKIHKEKNNGFIPRYDLLIKKMEPIQEYFREETSIKSYESRHLFGTAITPLGVKNFLSDLTLDYNKRVIITGSASGEIAMFLNKLAQGLSLLGRQSLFLHCGFDAEEYDGILLPNEKIAILDGNPPHTVLAKSSDILLNIDNLLDIKRPNLSISEMQELDNQYEVCFNKAITTLAEVKCLRTEIEEAYIQAMDFSLVNREYERLLYWLISLQEQSKSTNNI